MDNPTVTLKAVFILIPTTLRPMNTKLPMHDCIQIIQIIEQIYSSRSDLTDWPLKGPFPDLEMFTDGEALWTRDDASLGRW